MASWGNFVREERSKFSSQTTLYAAFYALFIKTNVPDSSLAEPPPDHHQSSTKFHSGCETLWLLRLSRTPSNHVSVCFRCAPGFSGEYCQHKDLCYVGYCLNGGECAVSKAGVPGSPSCVCPLGFTGQRCEKVYVPCYSSPCHNSGTCQQMTDTTYICHCLPG